MRLAELTHQLLMKPEGVQATELFEVLEQTNTSESAPQQAVYALLAAVALQRPALLDADGPLERWLADRFQDSEARMAPPVELVAGLASLGRLENRHVASAFKAEPLEQAITLAEQCAGWCPERIEWSDLRRLSERMKTSAHIDAFLVNVVDRWLASRPDQANQVLAAGAVELDSRFGHSLRWRWTRDTLRDQVREESRPAGRHTTPRAPHPAPPRMIVVQNLAIGHGDEILRFGPLLSILLQIAPDTQFDVITRRSYLWDHERLHTISIDDEPAIRDSLDRAEGFAWNDEPKAYEIHHLSWLSDAVRERASDAAWQIEMATQTNHLVFKRVHIAGVDRLEQLDPGMPPQHAYDSMNRLAHLLCVPKIGRTQGDKPSSVDAAPFVGTRSEESDLSLQRLCGESRRPLAVVQPFGGFAEIKGYSHGNFDRLAYELEALIEEGFQVLLIPAVEPWASPDAIKRLMDRMKPESASYVRIGLDPADPPSWLSERRELSPRDQVARCTKYWIAQADLVVAVEGWACHLAALLGRPVRMVLWAGSFSPDWYPRDAIWARSLSKNGRATPLHFSTLDPSVPLSSSTASLTATSLPESALLQLALDGLATREQMEELVPPCFGSVDPLVRARAVAISTRFLESTDLRQIVVRALTDPAPPVRAAAASAWLERTDLRSEWPLPASTLEAHCWIQASQWRKLLELGPRALPALATAAKGDPDFTRNQSRRLLRVLLHEQAARRSRDAPGSPPDPA